MRGRRTTHHPFVFEMMCRDISHIGLKHKDRTSSDELPEGTSLLRSVSQRGGGPPTYLHDLMANAAV